MFRQHGCFRSDSIDVLVRGIPSRATTGLPGSSQVSVLAEVNCLFVLSVDLVESIFSFGIPFQNWASSSQFTQTAENTHCCSMTAGSAGMSPAGNQHGPPPFARALDTQMWLQSNDFGNLRSLGVRRPQVEDSMSTRMFRVKDHCRAYRASAGSMIEAPSAGHRMSRECPIWGILYVFLRLVVMIYRSFSGSSLERVRRTRSKTSILERNSKSTTSSTTSSRSSEAKIR